MNNISTDPYKSPEANLLDSNKDGGISNFQVFSTWGALGLTIITLGIYPIYWLYTRAKVANSIHNNKMSDTLLNGFIIVTILSFTSGLFGDSDTAVLISSLISIIYLILYIVVLFTLRNRLQDIMTASSNSHIELSGFLTFFFFTLYLQYKINECNASLTFNEEAR